jgi:competence protein ComEC
MGTQETGLAGDDAGQRGGNSVVRDRESLVFGAGADGRATGRSFKPFRPRAFKYRLGRAFANAFAEEEAFGHTFLLYPVFMIAGAAWFFSLPYDIPALPIFAWLALLLPLSLRLRYSVPQLRYPVHLALCAVLGVASAAYQIAHNQAVILDGPVTATVTGIVRQAEATGRGQWRYTIDVQQIRDPRLRRPPGRVTLTARGVRDAYRAGDIIEGRARLQPPSGPALPGLNDFAFDSYFRGREAIGFFYGRPELVGTASRMDSQSGRAGAWIDMLRAAISRRILSILPGDTGAFAAAIITNDRASFSKEALESLRISGLAHVIAISGLHMALASGIFFFGLRFAFSLHPGLIQKSPAKKFSAVGALLAGGAYFLISGGPISAERAYIMLCVMLGAVIIGRPAFSLRGVAIAAMAIVALSPQSVVGPSFQMSFAAATALISGYSFWRLKPVDPGHLANIPVLRHLSPVMRFASGILLTSAIGGVSTGIFAAYHFNRITLYGLAANLAAMPVISVLVMPFGLLAVLLMPFGLDRLPLEIMGAGLRITLSIARTVSGWGGDIAIGQMAPWVLPVASTAFVLAVLPRTRLRYVGAFGFAAVMALSSAFGGVRKPDLVVFEGGDLAAFVDRQALATNRARPASFVFDQWERALAATEMVQPLLTNGLAARQYLAPLGEADIWKTEDAMEAAAKSTAPKRFVCHGKDWCLGRMNNDAVVITFRDPVFKENACRQADLAIAESHLRNATCETGNAVLIDRKILQRRGSLAVNEMPKNANGKLFQIRGALDGMDRPWNQHRYYDWRSRSYSAPYAVNDSGE